MDKLNDLMHPDPAYKNVLRINGLLLLLPVLVAAIGLYLSALVPQWLIFAFVVLCFTLLVLVFPSRRYVRRGYAMSEDALHVVFGFLFYSDSIVPFGRIQHIDVTRGPIERVFGLSTLIVHTAGTLNNIVMQPGLEHSNALAMRDIIRSHIGREAL